VLISAPVARADVNLALGRPATQSSFSQWSTPIGAQGAVDGIKNGGFGFHTQLQASPWWQVDLGAVRLVDRVVVFNRQDCCAERARTLQVLLSDNGAVFRTVYVHDGSIFGGARDGHPLQVMLNGAAARFVRLQLAATDYFHLDEVEVFGRGGQEQFPGALSSGGDVQPAGDAAPEVTTADPDEMTATTEPPEPIYEEPTDSLGPGYTWVGGSWGWTGADWAWYPGRWLTAPYGRVYVEPYYERVGPNVVYVRGYWGTADAPRRSYGGDRIVFHAAVRPADFRRGEPARVERRAGAAPGARPATAYVRVTASARPLPRATAPAPRVASVEARRSPASVEPAPQERLQAGGPAQRPSSQASAPAHVSAGAPPRRPAPAPAPSTPKK